LVSRKVLVFLLIVIFVFSIFFAAVLVASRRAIAGKLFNLKQNPSSVTFKLLAVEGDFDSWHMHSARHLIQNLTLYSNWQNTSGYNAYIHLLSLENYTGTEFERYWRGFPTKANIKNEIVNFLNQTFSGENPAYTIRVFYYIGHTTTQPIPNGLRYGMQAALQAQGYSPIWDDELDALLHPSTGPLSNSNSTIVILDSCYSGGYIQNLTDPGTVVLTAACPTQKANGWLKVSTQCLMPGSWGWFTGHMNACYSNQTSFGPLGIIGAIRNETDYDNNGWGTANEIFRFAYRTTVRYSLGQYEITKTESKPMLVQRPQRGYGVAGGAIPLVQYNSSASFPGIPRPLQTPVKDVESKFSKAEVPPTAKPAWPIFGQNPAHHGFSGGIGPAVNTLTWSYDLRFRATSSPATSLEGIAFAANEEGRLYALDVRNGEYIWDIELNATVFASPAFSDGIVYAGTLMGGNPSGRFYAINAYTGEPYWMFEFPSDTEAFASPTVAGEVVYAATVGPSGSIMGVYAFNKFNGALRWFYPTLAPVYSSPAVADGIVFFATNWDGSNMAYIYALNESTGDGIWQYPLGETLILSSPTVANGRLYIGIFGGISSQPQILALNEFTGNFEWSFLTSGPVSSSPSIDIAENRLIAASDDGIVYALNAENGDEQWTSPIGPVNMSSPAISNNSLVYIGSLDGRLYCLNETNGTILWDYLTGGQVISSPALTQENVLFASTDGNLYCIGPEFPIHDVAVIDAAVNQTVISLADIVQINYTLANLGNREETFQISLCYNTTEIWMPPTYGDPVVLYSYNITLQPGQSLTLTYNFNVSTVSANQFTIVIVASNMQREDNPNNNRYIDGSIKVSGVGGRRGSIPVLT